MKTKEVTKRWKIYENWENKIGFHCKDEARVSSVLHMLRKRRPKYLKIEMQSLKNGATEIVIEDAEWKKSSLPGGRKGGIDQWSEINN